MRTLCGLLFGLATCLAIGAALQAAEYFVDQAKGNDASGGSQAAPWLTVSRGVRDLKPGDTLTVGPGVYRETVTVTCRGTAEAPITIRSVPAGQAAITGADAVTGWKKCTAEMAGGNPLADRIYYADIEWQTGERPAAAPGQRRSGAVPALYAAKEEQSLGRFPAEGWLRAGATTETTLTDEKNLTQKRDVWKGARIVLRFSGGLPQGRTVTSFDPATHTWTLNAPLTAYQPADKVEYWVEGRLPGIHKPGQWAWEPTGEQTVRVYYMPTGEKIADGEIEMPRRPRQMILGQAAHVVIDGFDMGYGAYTGNSGDSVLFADAADAQDGGGQGLVIRNCSMHDHKRFGVYIHGWQNPKLQRCLIAENGYGVMLEGNTGALVEECEIARNQVDGFRDTFKGRGTVVRRCYIHHHFDSSAHPDNVQLHDDVRDILFDSNLLVCGGQSVMMSNVDGVTFRNNVLAGSVANMMICGHNSVKNGTFERNTFVLWAMSMFALSNNTLYRMKGNILVNQGAGIFYAVPEGTTCESDNNLFWVSPGYDAGSPWRGKGGSYAALADLQKATPWEAHSEFRDPQFASTPLYMTLGDYHRQDGWARDRVVVSRPQLFKSGDHVETNFDGVVRTVKAVEGNTVIFDPPMPKVTFFVLLCNWKDKTAFRYDFKTPLGDKYGSTINVPEYMKGDFDGDGKRDVPSYR